MNIRPYVVEFSGTPEAGKTTTIKNLIPIISDRLNCKIGFVQESAELLPNTFVKGSFEATVWMREKTFSSLSLQLSNPLNDIIILDRGCIDQNFFNYKFYTEGLCTKDEYEFRLKRDLRQDFFPNLCIVLKTSPEESIRRRGGEGRLVTISWVKNYNILLDDFFSRFQKIFTTTTFFTLDTTTLSKSSVIETISNKIIASYKDST